MKEYNIIPDPIKKSITEGVVGLKSYPLWNKRTMTIPLISISTDMVIGAITGPIQGKGIKNKMSHSTIDRGQSIKNLSHT
jgi:hypothetical protein